MASKNECGGEASTSNALHLADLVSFAGARELPQSEHFGFKKYGNARMFGN